MNKAACSVAPALVPEVCFPEFEGKFPVKWSREFVASRRYFLPNSSFGLSVLARTKQIPCFFPDNQGMEWEDGCDQDCQHRQPSLRSQAARGLPA